MLTLLLSIAICTLALLLPRHAFSRARQNYIEQRRLSAGLIVPTGTRTSPLAIPATPPRRA